MSEHKHDGKLPAGSGLSVDGEVRWSGSFLTIECGKNTVVLDGLQALGLLGWLEEEYPRIGTLARELKGKVRMSTHYDTRQKSDGLWYIVGSMDDSNWYYVHEQLFNFPSQNEARAWLIAEGYTSEEMGKRIQKAVKSRRASL